MCFMLTEAKVMELPVQGLKHFAICILMEFLMISLTSKLYLEYLFDNKLTIKMLKKCKNYKFQVIDIIIHRLNAPTI